MWWVVCKVLWYMVFKGTVHLKLKNIFVLLPVVVLIHIVCFGVARFRRNLPFKCLSSLEDNPQTFL